MVEQVPAWLAITAGIGGVLVGLVTIATFGRLVTVRLIRSTIRAVLDDNDGGVVTWMKTTIRAVLNEPNGALMRLADMERRAHDLERHVYNGLTEEVDRIGTRVDEIRLTTARIEERLGNK